VRIEPGLSELCIEKIFEQQPRLRPASDALQAALTRTEVDLSSAPHEPSLPEWPERARDANTRVLDTAQALAVRHPGEAILLVCHAHSLVELTRHLAKSGGGAAGSNPGYCAISHISPGGDLVRCLDLQYLRQANDAGSSSGGYAAWTDIGQFSEDWRWVEGDGSDDASAEAASPSHAASPNDMVERLLNMGLDRALEKYPDFRSLFERGTSEQQDAWRQGWEYKSDDVRKKLQKACAANLLLHPCTAFQAAEGSSKDDP